MKKIFAAAALAAGAALASPASAALVNVTISVSAPGFQGGGAGFEAAPLGQLAPGYFEAGMTFTPGAPTLVRAKTGNVGGAGAFPFGDTSNRYLSVNANSFVDITALGAPASRLSLYWGSVDKYNLVQFFKTGNAVAVASLTGADALPLLATGNQTSYNSNRFVTINLVSGNYDYVRLSSGANAFEIDNIAAGVPEASTWAMMLVGFFGLAALSRRRKSSATLAA